MKKLKYLLVINVVFFGTIFKVNAASASLSVNKSSVENGGTVSATATLSGTAAWNVSITSTGATQGCSQRFADATGDGNNTTKYLTVTCKATSVGIINFSLSGDITSSDGSNQKISDSKTVKVVKPREKSTNNNLKDLSVEGYEISPKFDAKTKEYSVNVPNTVDKIKIIATKADGYASLSGDGEKEVEEGANLFEIVVTSETGVANLYKLTVNVEDLNPIEVTVGDKKYTLVKNPKNLTKPDLFTETTVTIDGSEIPGFVNENTKCTLVGLKDESGKIYLFIYEDGKYTLYNEYKTNNMYIMFLKMENVPALYKKYKLLVYGQNIESGEKNYYTYDRKEKTLQIFNKNAYDKNYKENQNIKLLLYGLSISVVLFFILLMLVSSKCSKLKKMLISKNIEKHEEKEALVDNKNNEEEQKDLVKENDEDTEEVEEESFLDEKPKKKRKNKKVK